MAQTVKITPATGLLEFIGDNVANKPVLQHDNAGNLTLTLQSAKKFTIGGNLKVNGKVTMAQQTLTDGAAITWDFNSGANAKVTIAGARTLVIANMEAGDTGLILVKQDAAGGRTLTLPGGSSIVGGGSYTASSAANATDVLGVYYDGTTYWWTIGYNTVTPPLTSVGITGSDFVIANSPLTSNGNIGLALATVNSNVGTFGSATAVPVITVNGKGLVTAVSATNISIPTNLDSLTDVTISLAATGQLLQFNGSQWVNWTPNYVPTSRTLSINGTSYDLSANRAWTIDTVSYVSRVQHGVKAAVAINKGQAVYVTSADGTNMIVDLASNGSEATSSKTMGLLDATVAINGMANVVTEGLLAGLDTSLAGTEGDPVWLGDNGNLIYGLPNKPYAPRHLVFIGIVTRKNANTGEIFVKVQNGFELKEIHDVDLITTVPVNGHILGYDGTLWVNKTIAGWLGFTPANDANVVHTTGNESIAGIKTFSGTTQATSTSTGTIVTAGGVGIAKNLYVGGDLNVVGNLIIGGTTTTVYAQNLAVSDNMIYLNNGIATTITNAVGNGSSVVYTTQETHNYVIGMSVTITGVSPTAYNLSNQIITGVSTNSFTIANSATGSYSSGGTARAKSNANPDLGFAAGYNDGSYAHAGLFRDATDNTWKFFKGYTPEPDASPFIDTSHASFALADLAANDITGRSFIKVGGTSSQFLKADGSVDSNTYLTTGTASTTYQPLDGDLTAIAGLTATGFLKRTGTNTWTLDSNVYLTAESDTLASVVGRGATSTAQITVDSVITTNNGNGTNFRIGDDAWIGDINLANTFRIQGAQDPNEAYIVFGEADNTALGRTGPGDLTYGNNVIWHAGNLTNLNQLTNGPGYITSASLSGYVPTSRTLTINGTTYDLSANRSWTITAGVSSVSAGAGISVNSTTGDVTVTNTITNLNQLTNGPGYITGYTETDTLDSVISRGDTTARTTRFYQTSGTTVDVVAAGDRGLTILQDSAGRDAYITFHIEGDYAGYFGLGGVENDLVWGGWSLGAVRHLIWHSGNLTNLNQLTNGPGYITSAALSGYVPTSRTLTINGTTYDLSANRSWTITAGVSSVSAGTGISVNSTTGAVTVTNTGLLSATAGTGITVSTSNQNLTINTTALLSATAGTGITVSTSNQNLTINTTALLSATAGTGITVSTSNQNLTINNTGLLSAAAGTGITVSTSNQQVTINNTGLLSAVAGAGISVSTSNQQVTITNTITNNNQLTNGSGYITGITSANVTTALGYTPWHPGNDGSGSGLDADLLDGYHASGSVGANTVVIRDGNGYIYANYINTNVSETENPSINSFFTSNGDGWLRKSTLAHVRSSLGNYGGWLTQAAADPLYVNITGDSMTGPLVISGVTSGQELFAVNGVNGRLFTVTDDLSNSLFSVNTIAGLPVIEAFANNTVKLGPFSAPITINASGISTPSHGTSANWYSAYNDTITSASVSGTSTKTLTLTQRDGGTVTASWTDIDTDTNTDAQTLTLNGSTLSISGGNSITLPTGGISQGTADSLYVNVTGDSMSGNLYVYPSSNPAQIQLVGTNPELYVSASTGTSRVFINREASGNQATLMFTTGMNVSQGVAWDYTGMPMWSMGMTNNNNTDSFKLGYGDIYEPTSVALEITSANVAYFRNVPYGGGNLLATQSWVTSQGYITGVSDVWVNTSGDTMTGDLVIRNTGSYNNLRLLTNDDNSWIEQTKPDGTIVGRIGFDGYSTANAYYTDYAVYTRSSADADIARRIYINNSRALYFENLTGFTYNGNTIWHAGNDGAGSGLDADLLDGYNADTVANVNTIVRRDSSGNIYSNYVLGTYFNASNGNSENPTIGQIWTQNTSDNYLRKSTPAHFRSQVIDGYYLPLSGGTITGTVNFSNNNLDGVGHITMSDSGFGEGIQWESWFICDSPNDNSNQTGNLQFVYVPDNNVRMTFDTGGTLTLSNRLVELSSIRYKTNVESLTPALDKVLQLRPVYYTKIGGTGSTEIGLIAEEVAEIYPELIKYDDAGQVDGINYTRIAPILIKTIQEQQELIKNLTKRIDDLENR